MEDGSDLVMIYFFLRLMEDVLPIMQRKHSTLASEGEVSTHTEREILWRVNSEEFLHRFRHKVSCIFRSK